MLVNSLGEAYLGQLARMMGIRPARVLALMYGAPPSYSRELGVHVLGLIEEIPRARGRAWRITQRGRRKCRSWASARAKGRRDRQQDAGAENEASKGTMPPAASQADTQTWRFSVEG